MNHCLNDVRPSKCMFLFASIYKGNKSVLLQNDTNRGVSSFFAKCFNYLCLKSFYGSEQNEVVSLLCSTNLTNGKNWQEENNLVMCGLHSLAFCITLSVHYIIIGRRSQSGNCSKISLVVAYILRWVAPVGLLFLCPSRFFIIDFQWR